MKKSLILAFCSLIGILASRSEASVTIQFTDPTGNFFSGLGNAASIATGGMLYGMVVDTTGNGFDVGNYIAFNTGTPGFLSTASGLTDDFFYTDGSVTFDASAFTETPGGAFGDSGTIINIASVPTNNDIANGVTQGDVFGLIWFPSATANTGENYGFQTNAAFVIPSNGDTVNYSPSFAGSEPVVGATNTIAAIPEPSRMVLMGLGGLLVMFRRRR